MVAIEEIFSYQFSFADIEAENTSSIAGPMLILEFMPWIG